jgi:hypothetical protein
MLDHAKEENTGGWRKQKMRLSMILLFTKHYWDNQIKENEWTGNVARMGQVRNEYIILIGNSEGKRPLTRPWHKWEDNIKIDRK